MKSTIIFLNFIFTLGMIQLSGQDVSFEFANAEITNVGPNNSYEVDIIVSSASGFKLGSGQLYFDYNPAAFGNSAVANGGVVVAVTGDILGQSSGPFGIYTSFILNDNTTNRLSFSWQQALSSGCIATENVTASSDVLFHLRMAYIPGGDALDPGICFTSNAPFDDQTFTACGPGANCTFPDCIGSAGTQITNDFFDCSDASNLPIELLAFNAVAIDKKVSLDWETASEKNNHYFEVERSRDGLTFEPVQKVEGAGTVNEARYYELWDERPFLGLNYYRLKQVDLDGSFDYSEIRVVEFQIGKTAITVYPNPTEDYLGIVLNESDERQPVKLYNELGQLSLEGMIDQKEYQKTFDISHLPKGVYLLQVGERQSLFTTKIILQ